MKKSPQRIISLVPSQTELLYDLGLDEEVVGITKFCVHPEKWFRTKTRIGGTKNINIEKIIALKPYLVIANKEENIKNEVEALKAFTEVYVSDVFNLHDAIKMILTIGEIVDKSDAATTLTTLIKENFAALGSFKQERSVVYLIWQKPFMAAGGDTFINDMMQYCGMQNMFANKLRYPETTLKELQALDCDVLLLSSEPFPFKQKHIDELQPYLPKTKIILVDGEMFSWYGSRLLHAAEYFKQLSNSLE